MEGDYVTTHTQYITHCHNYQSFRGIEKNSRCKTRQDISLNLMHVRVGLVHGLNPLENEVWKCGVIFGEHDQLQPHTAPHEDGGCEIISSWIFIRTFPFCFCMTAWHHTFSNNHPGRFCLWIRPGLAPSSVHLQAATAPANCSIRG